MFQLGIFDDNKGRKEGEEAEKIVAWYPVTTAVEYQVRSIGLLQGLLQFLSIFDSVRRFIPMMIHFDVDMESRSALVGTC